MANIFEIEKKNGEIFIEHFKMWNASSIRAYNFNHRAQLLRFVSIRFDRYLSTRDIVSGTFIVPQ